MERTTAGTGAAGPGAPIFLTALGATAVVALFAVIQTVATDGGTWGPAVWCFLGSLLLVSVATVVWWTTLHRPAAD